MQAQAPDYRNASLPIDRRVADLLARMTLEEKVAQLTCLWGGRPQVNPQTDFSTDRGDLSIDKARVVLKNGIGQISRQRERKDPRESALFAACGARMSRSRASSWCRRVVTGLPVQCESLSPTANVSGSRDELA